MRSIVTCLISLTGSRYKVAQQERRRAEGGRPGAALSNGIGDGEGVCTTLLLSCNLLGLVSAMSEAAAPLFQRTVRSLSCLQPLNAHLEGAGNLFSCLL